MNLTNSTKAIIEASITSILMAAFALLGLYIFPTALIFYAIPFIVIGVRHGTKYSIYSLAITSLMIAVITNGITAIMLFVTFGFLAISFGYMIRRKYPPLKILVFNFGIGLISILLALTFYEIISGIKFINGMEEFFSNALNIYVESIKNAGFSSNEVTQMKEVLEEMFDLTTLLVPFLVIASSILTTSIAYWGSAVVLKKFGRKDISMISFKHLRLPKHIILGSVVMLVGSFVIRVLGILYSEAILINTFAIIMFVFFLEGLSVIAYFMDKFKFNIILKILIVILSIINSVIISVVGFIDVIFNLRKIEQVN